MINGMPIEDSKLIWTNNICRNFLVKNSEKNFSYIGHFFQKFSRPIRGQMSKVVLKYCN